MKLKTERLSVSLDRDAWEAYRYLQDECHLNISGWTREQLIKAARERGWKGHLK